MLLFELDCLCCVICCCGLCVVMYDDCVLFCCYGVYIVYDYVVV